MVSTGAAIAAGVGGLIAAEATGVTNFSGGGSSNSPAVPSLPDTGPSTAELFALMQAGGNSGESVTRIVESGGGGNAAGMAEAFAKLQASNNQTLAAVVDSMDSGGGGGGTTTIVERAGAAARGGSVPGADRFTGNDSPGQGITNRQVAAASQGRDPFGLQATTESGSLVGQTAEALRAAGDTPGNLAGDFGDPENSGGLAGFSYDAGAAAGQGISEIRSWL